jgi:hypothetical protein
MGVDRCQAGESRMCLVFALSTASSFHGFIRLEAPGRFQWQQAPKANSRVNEEQCKMTVYHYYEVLIYGADS